MDYLLEGRWTRLASPLLGCVLLACGAGTHAGETTPPDDPDSRTGDPSPSSAAICPAGIDDAENMRCGEGGVPPELACSYPEGECTCGRRPECSGAEEEPPDPSVPEVFVWVCRRTPPEVRPDGCPGVMPTAGMPCDEVGKRCWYGECCVEPVDCTADGWSEPGMTECPP